MKHDARRQTEQRRRMTQQDRAIDRLFADLDAYDKDALRRSLRSGLSYVESLEYLRLVRMFKD